MMIGVSGGKLKEIYLRGKNKMYIRILENDDWIVEYDIENNKYRVSYFQDNHFVDDILFDEVDRSKSVKNKK